MSIAIPRSLKKKKKKKMKERKRRDVLSNVLSALSLIGRTVSGAIYFNVMNIDTNLFWNMIF